MKFVFFLSLSKSYNNTSVCSNEFISNKAHEAYVREIVLIGEIMMMINLFEPYTDITFQNIHAI